MRRLRFIKQGVQALRTRLLIWQYMLQILRREFLRGVR
jgi:hypothetical protein